MAIGDPEGALAVLEEAESVCPARRPAPAAGDRARAELASPAASPPRRPRGFGPAACAPMTRRRTARHGEYRVLARVLIAEQRPRRRRWRCWSAGVRWPRRGTRAALVIAVQALMALAHAASGDEPAALGALEEALTLAAPEG